MARVRRRETRGQLDGNRGKKTLGFEWALVPVSFCCLSRSFFARFLQGLAAFWAQSLNAQFADLGSWTKSILASRTAARYCPKHSNKKLSFYWQLVMSYLRLGIKVALWFTSSSIQTYPPSLFVFQNDDSQQNVNYFLTPVFNSVFIALSHGVLQFALYGSWLVEITKQPIRISQFTGFFQLPWREKRKVPSERA